MLVNKLLLPLGALRILTGTAVEKEMAGFCQPFCSLKSSRADTKQHFSGDRKVEGAPLHFYPTHLEVTCKCKKYIHHTPLSRENSDKDEYFRKDPNIWCGLSLQTTRSSAGPDL